MQFVNGGHFEFVVEFSSSRDQSKTDKYRSIDYYLDIFRTREDLLSKRNVCQRRNAELTNDFLSFYFFKNEQVLNHFEFSFGF